MIPAGAWCLEPGAWCLVPGAWCLLCTIRFMPVDIDITKVARLARIGLTAEELAAYSAWLRNPGTRRSGAGPSQRRCGSDGASDTDGECLPVPMKRWSRPSIAKRCWLPGARP